MTALRLGSAGDAPFELPLDAQTQAFAIVGRRGSGKTNTAVVMVEEMVEHGLAVCVMDVLGVWWGLRSSADGEGPGLPVTILGGAHGDVPLEPGSGAFVADFIVQNPGAYVIDLSSFDTKTQEDSFAADFAHRLYRAKAHDQSALHLVIDEADNFAPQNPQPGQQRMLGAFNDISRRGRVRGLAPTLITQRPAALNKNVLSQSEVLIAMQVTAPQDRDALKEWVKVNGDASKTDQFLGSLAGLQLGEAWLWSPSWLQTFDRIQVRRRRTFDSSATPRAGEVRVEPRVLAPVDLETLRTQMAATIEKAEADDPKKLRAEIARLKATATTKESFVVQPCDHEPQLQQLDALNRKLIEDLAAQADTIVHLMEEMRGQHATILLLRGALAYIRTQTNEALEEADANTGADRIRSHRSDEEAGAGARRAGASPTLPASRPSPSSPARAGQSDARPNEGLGEVPGGSRSGGLGARKSRGGSDGRDTNDMKDEEVREMIKELLRESGRVLVVPPAEVIRKDYLGKAIDRLMTDVKELGQDALEVYRFLISREVFLSLGQIMLVLVGYSGGNGQTRWAAAVKELVDAGLVAKGGSGGNGFKADDAAARARIVKALEPHNATQQEIEEVYQAVLGRLAGEGVLA